jgi:hypothetical protein
MQTFFNTNPELELLRQPVARYVLQHPDSLKGITTPRQLFLDELGAIQRIFRVAPQYEHVQALLAAGYHSARAISRKSRAVFTSQLKQALGTAAAGAVYDRATHVAAVMSNVRVQEQASIFDSSIESLQDGSMNVAARQAQKELFGSLDSCACPDCCSVLF